jgi:spermidine synthase
MRLDERLTATSGVYVEAGELLASVQSAHQLIEVFATADWGKLMRLDGANMVAEGDEFLYHESLVHPAAIAHPAPREVLIIGGGDGGAAEEILKHPSVSSVVVCELDGAVVEVAKAHFADVHRGAFADPRLTLRIGDGLAYLRATDRRFDLIYLDLTDPSGASAALYTPAFYADCRRALARGGALTLHIGSPFAHPQRVRQSVDELRRVFARLSLWFLPIPSYGANWGFACAAEDLDPAAISAAEIDARLAQRGIADRQLYEGQTHHAMMSLPPYLRKLVAMP